jgi:hypothetical protein
MGNLVIACLATAFAVSGFEEFALPLGRLKGAIVPIVLTMSYIWLDPNLHLSELILGGLGGSYATLWVLATFSPEPAKRVSALRLPKGRKRV